MPYLNHVIFTAELSCAKDRSQSVIRFSIFNQAIRKQILSTVFIDRTVFESEMFVADEVMTALKSGFSDSVYVL